MTSYIRKMEGCGEDILEMMTFAKGRIGHVHLKDQTAKDNHECVTLGLGAVPHEKVVRAIKALVDIPVVAGFGIRPPEGGAAVAAQCAGFVIGSSLDERFMRRVHPVV